MAGRFQGRLNWFRLVAGVSGIAVLSLSIHVFLLQGFHVPYPDYGGVGYWGLLEPAGHVLGLMLLYQLAQPRLPQRFFAQVAVMSIIDAMIAEKLRLGIMNGVTSASVAFPAITTALDLVDSVCAGLLIVSVAKLLKSLPLRIAGALLLLGAYTFFTAPIHQHVLAHFGALQRPELYHEPYGPVVLTISYALFVLTAATTFVIVWLIAGQLSPAPAWNLLQTAGIVLLLRGTLVAQFIFPWRMTGALAFSALTVSQFFLQDLLMTVLCWSLWKRTRTTAGWTAASLSTS